MIDIKEIRENPEKYKKAAKDKFFNVNIEKLLKIDSELKDQKQHLQDISTEKNQIGKSIPKLSPGEKKSAFARLSELKEQETTYNEDIKKLQPQFDDLYLNRQ